MLNDTETNLKDVPDLDSILANVRLLSSKVGADDFSFVSDPTSRPDTPNNESTI